MFGEFNEATQLKTSLAKYSIEFNDLAVQMRPHRIAYLRLLGRPYTLLNVRRSVGRLLKRRNERGYFNNIIKELRVEHRFGFREMFRMDVIDFESTLGKIADQIQPKERLGGTNPINSDERLALTLRFFYRFFFTGETFKSLSF